MAQLEPLKEYIQRTGSLLYIAAEKRAGFFKPEKYLAKNPVSFPFLLDEDRSVTKAYGVYHRLARDAYNIARPATFVVDRGGVLRYVFVSRHQKERADLKDVMAVFGKL